MDINHDFEFLYQNRQVPSSNVPFGGPPPLSGQKPPFAHRSSLGTLPSLGRPVDTGLVVVSHNAEPDAVDLFEEVEIIGEVANLVDESTYGRVCQYIHYVTIHFFPALS